MTNRYGTNLAPLLGVISMIGFLGIGLVEAATLRPAAPQIVAMQAAPFEGSQFAPNETIIIREFRVIPGEGTVVLPAQYQATSSVSGQFSLQWTFSDADLDIQVYLEATGQSSGLSAQSQVFLSKSILTLTRETEDPFCLDTLTPASTYRYRALLEFVCADGSRVPLPNRIVEFFPVFGDCEATPYDKKFGGGYTNSDGVITFDLDRLDTLVTDTGTFSVLAVFAGEKKPSAANPPNSPCNGIDRVDIMASSDCHSTPVVSDCSTDDGFTILPSASADVFYVHTVDLDRDNYTDAIYTGETTEGLFIAFGSRTGGFWPPAPFLNVKLAAVDADYINADTLIDIIAVTTSMTYYLLNEGNRQFSVDSVASSAAIFEQAVQSKSSDDVAESATPSVVSGYFNDDDLLDLVVAPGLFFAGTGTTGFFSASLLPFGLDVVDACDFTGDGKQDLVVTDDNQLRIMVNDGDGNFSPGYQALLDGQSVLVPPIFAVSDINADGFCDVAIVLPLASAPGESRITIVYGDGAGGASATETITFAALAVNLVVADINKDNLPDIVTADGSAGRLRIFLQLAGGGWSEPQTVNLESSTTLTYALASLDLDRDGNYDFVTGGVGGGSLIIALDEQPDQPILADELTVTGLSYLNIKVTNPNGFSISEQFQTIAGSDYQSLDVNGDGQIDERTLDYNLQDGQYCIVATLEPDAPAGGTFSVGVGIDGSQQFNIVDGFDPNGSPIARPGGDSIVYCFDISEITAVEPNNGSVINYSRPVFDWSGQLELQQGNPRPNLGSSFDFQLSRTIDFQTVRFETSGIESASYQLPFTLGNDTTWYWRIREINDADTGAFSNIFIVRVANLCCLISTGNIDQDQVGNLDINDITRLVEFLFGSGTPIPSCPGLGDLDSNGQIDIADVIDLVDYTFMLTGASAPLCP